MSEKQVDQAFDIGIADAQSVIASNGLESNSLDDLIHYHALKKSGDQRMLKHSLGTFIDAKRNGEFEEYDITEDPHMATYLLTA